MSALTVDDCLRIRGELIFAWLDRAKAGDLEAVQECRKLLRDHSIDLRAIYLERDTWSETRSAHSPFFSAYLV